MLKYDGHVNPDLESDQWLKAKVEHAQNMYKYLEQHHAEILETLQTQLNMSGVDRRAEAVDAIMYYLYDGVREKLRVDDAYNIVSCDKYASNLIYLTNIIEAVNSKNPIIIKKLVAELPWGGSNRGHVITDNTTMFAYWILSDEAREEYGDIFREAVKDNALTSDEKKIEKELDELESMSKLDKLIALNHQTKKELEVKAKTIK